MIATLCGARTRSGAPCKVPTMKNGRCRMHGGKSLRGKEHGGYKHGRRSKDYLAQRRQWREIQKNLQELIDGK